jgi:hypothetical protein
MFKWTTVVLAGLACCLTLPALNAGTDMGCLAPPLTQDYLKKTVRVEIKGKLERLRVWLEPDDVRDPTFHTPKIGFLDSWHVTVGGKTYVLDLGINSDVEQRATVRDFSGLANKLVGKVVIVTGTLGGDTVHVMGMKADEDYVKQTTEVEARGQLRAEYRELVRPDAPQLLERFPPIIDWSFAVDGKTYTLKFATPELEKLAKALDGKAVVLTGTLDKDTITVKTLKAAQ